MSHGVFVATSCGTKKQAHSGRVISLVKSLWLAASNRPERCGVAVAGAVLLAYMVSTWLVDWHKFDTSRRIFSGETRAEQPWPCPRTMSPCAIAFVHSSPSVTTTLSRLHLSLILKVSFLIMAIYIGKTRLPEVPHFPLRLCEDTLVKTDPLSSSSSGQMARGKWCRVDIPCYCLEEILNIGKKYEADMTLVRTTQLLCWSWYLIIVHVLCQYMFQWVCVGIWWTHERHDDTISVFKQHLCWSIPRVVLCWEIWFVKETGALKTEASVSLHRVNFPLHLSLCSNILIS